MGRQQGASLSPHAAPNKQTGRFRDFAGAQLCSIGSGSFSDVFRGAAYEILFLAYEVPPARYKLCVFFVNSITILELNLPLFSPLYSGFNSSVSAVAHILSTYSAIDLCC